MEVRSRLRSSREHITGRNPGFPQETVRRCAEDMHSIMRNIKRALSPRDVDFQAFTVRPADVYADIRMCDMLTIRAFSDAIPHKIAIRVSGE